MPFSKVPLGGSAAPGAVGYAPIPPAPAAPPTADEEARTERVGSALRMGGLSAANRYHASCPSRLYSADDITRRARRGCTPRTISRVVPVEAVLRGRYHASCPSRLYSADELVDYVLLHRKQGATLDGTPVVVGFVGYPNVGKSSTINALWQSKRVTVSATPGKTKHFQTLRLEHERRVMLCDCPGLVFPSFASTRDHMVVDGVLPISQLRDAITPMQIISARIPRPTFELKYTLDLDPDSEQSLRDRDESPTLAHRIANAYARLKGYMTDHDKPNTNRGARDILQDYVSGNK
eukprot:gene20261-54599_t